jgi:peroxisomal 2,4-dienoyl-CoA reductase
MMYHIEFHHSFDIIAMSDQSPYRQDILSGKVAIVTGGGSGIGFEIAKQLGLHGATITISGRRSDVLDSACDTLRGLGIDAMFVQVGILNLLQLAGYSSFTVAVWL